MAVSRIVFSASSNQATEWGPSGGPEMGTWTDHGWARIAATVAHAQRDSPARQSSPGPPAGTVPSAASTIRVSSSCLDST